MSEKPGYSDETERDRLKFLWDLLNQQGKVKKRTEKDTKWIHQQQIERNKRLQEQSKPDKKQDTESDSAE